MYCGTSALAHELLGHSLLANRGNLNLKTYIVDEIFSINQANIYRESVCEPLRSVPFR